jgi:hypothetical protein
VAVKKVEEFTVQDITYAGCGYWYKDNESMTLTFQGEGFKVEVKVSLRDYKSLAKRMASIVKEMEGVEVESD